MKTPMQKFQDYLAPGEVYLTLFREAMLWQILRNKQCDVTECVKIIKDIYGIEEPRSGFANSCADMCLKDALMMKSLGLKPSY